MIVKKHSTHDGKAVLAICDNELLDKKFEENDLQLDLTSEFYKGEEMPEQEILKILPEVNSLNIVGEKSTQFALKNNLIQEDHIKKIQNIPYAICVFAEPEQN